MTVICCFYGPAYYSIGSYISLAVLFHPGMGDVDYFLVFSSLWCWQASETETEEEGRVT